MIKILILSDSLALSRERPERCNFEDTWPQLIKKENVIIHQVSIGGATSEDLLKQCPYHSAFNPDIVIVQVGIVDAAPRFMSKSELSVAKKMPFIGKLIIKLMNNSKVRKVRNITYVNTSNFKNNIFKIRDYFKNAKVLFIEILPVHPEYEKTLPGISKNVEMYNEILKESNFTLSHHDFDFLGLMSDFHHINAKGHKLISDKIQNILSDIHI